MTDDTERASTDPGASEGTGRGRSRRPRAPRDDDGAAPAAPAVRPQSYLIGHTREKLTGGLKPLNLQMLSVQLPDLEGVTITRTIEAAPALADLGLFSAV